VKRRDSTFLVQRVFERAATQHTEFWESEERKIVMPRVKRGVTAHARHKKVLDLAKGYRGRRKNVYRIAKQAVMKAGQYAYRDRRAKKRTFRSLWIARINAGARLNGLTYSTFMNGLRKAEVTVDRKILSDMAIFDPTAFTKFAEQAKSSLAA